MWSGQRSGWVSETKDYIILKKSDSVGSVVELKTIYFKVGLHRFCQGFHEEIEYGKREGTSLSCPISYREWS